jgi:hypothetical protein
MKITLEIPDATHLSAFIAALEQLGGKVTFHCDPKVPALQQRAKTWPPAASPLARPTKRGGAV